jgi:hypothetical protein
LVRHIPERRLLSAERLLGTASGNYLPNQGGIMAFVLWIIAVILVISGIFSIFRGSVLAGVVLIVVGLLVGPGGVSIFT